MEEANKKSGIGLRDSNDRQTRQKIVENLWSKREYRRLMRIPSGWRADLGRLAMKFPNFREVVDYLYRMFALAELGDRSLYVDRIRLNGPSGVGKSFFAEYFAMQFGPDFGSFRMENAQSNSDLSGSSEFGFRAQPPP